VYMGISGQIMPVTIPSDTGNGLRSGGPGALAPLSFDPRARLERAQPWSVRLEERRQRGMLMPGLQSYVRRQARADGAGDSVGISHDSSVIPLPVLYPFFGMASRKHAPTLGIDAQVALLMMRPAAIIASPYMDWRVGREVHVGVTPEFLILPFLLPTGLGINFSAPFWISWYRYGYYNQDIEYNLAGVTNLTGFVSPELSPFVRIGDNAQGGQATEPDTSVTNKLWLMTGLEFRQGLPVLRYGSVIVGTDDYLSVLGDEQEDPMGELAGESSLYAQFGGNVECVFPIVRNINRGRLYADNLYGAVYYALTVYGDGDFLSHGSLRVIGDPLSDTTDVSVAHTLGARVDFGFIKSYVLTRRLSAGVSWEFVKQRLSFSFMVLL
jgi:hypothetical protein